MDNTEQRNDLRSRGLGTKGEVTVNVFRNLTYAYLLGSKEYEAFNVDGFKEWLKHFEAYIDDNLEINVPETIANLDQGNPRGLAEFGLVQLRGLEDILVDVARFSQVAPIFEANRPYVDKLNGPDETLVTEYVRCYMNS